MIRMVTEMGRVTKIMGLPSDMIRALRQFASIIVPRTRAIVGTKPPLVMSHSPLAFSFPDIIEYILRSNAAGIDGKTHCRAW